MRPWWKKWWVWLLGIVLLVLIVFTVLYPSSSRGTEVSLSQFLADVQAGDVAKIEVSRRTVDYELRGVQGTYTTELEPDDSVRAVLSDAGIEPGSPNYPVITTDARSTVTTVLSIILLQFVPIVIIIAILAFFLRQASTAQRRWPFSMLVTNYDPVCRSTVNPSSAAGSSTFMSNTYYFCSAEHKEQFDADPAKFLLQK